MKLDKLSYSDGDDKSDMSVVGGPTPTVSRRQNEREFRAGCDDSTAEALNQKCTNMSVAKRDGEILSKEINQNPCSELIAGSVYQQDQPQKNQQQQQEQLLSLAQQPSQERQQTRKQQVECLQQQIQTLLQQSRDEQNKSESVQRERDIKMSRYV